jgi:hypothetical protein
MDRWPPRYGTGTGRSGRLVVARPWLSSVRCPGALSGRSDAAACARWNGVRGACHRRGGAVCSVAVGGVGGFAVPAGRGAGVWGGCRGRACARLASTSPTPPPTPAERGEQHLCWCARRRRLAPGSGQTWSSGSRAARRPAGRGGTITSAASTPYGRSTRACQPDPFSTIATRPGTPTNMRSFVTTGRLYRRQVAAIQRSASWIFWCKP